MAIVAADLEIANDLVKKVLGDVLKSLSVLTDLQRQIQTQIDNRASRPKLMTAEEDARAEMEIINFNSIFPIQALDVLQLAEEERELLAVLMENV